MPLRPGFPASWGLSVHATLPFESLADVLAIMPGWAAQDVNPDPVRDALAYAWLKAYAIWTSDSAAFAASLDPNYAVGSSLDLCGRQVGVARALNEDDTTYRARVLAGSSLVTPAALMAQVTAIVQSFRPTSVPYYWERPDDDPFVFANGSGGNDGWYVSSAAGPIASPEIEASDRQYAARGVQQPSYAFVWDTLEDPAGPLGVSGARALATALASQGAIAGPIYTDAYSSWGTAIVAIPNFPQLGVEQANDFFTLRPWTADATGASSSITPMIDINGNLTSWAASAAATMGDIFTKASDPGDLTGGVAIFSADGDASTVISRIQALFDAAGPVMPQVTILLDPQL